MSWNKEKITLALALVILCWCAVQVTGSFFLGDPLSGIQLQDPSPSSAGVVGASVRIDWFEQSSLGDLARDPFQSVSDWRSVPADLIGPPPFPALRRRIPLPAPVEGVVSARLAVEETPPESENSNGDPGGEQ